MQTVKINLWSPHPNQKRVVDSPARFKVVVAGRRFGKTILAVSFLFKKALLKSNGQFFYIAPFYKQGKMISWKIIQDLVQKLPTELIKSVNESALSVEFANGSTIFIKGADRPDTLRGIGLDGVVLDEFADMRSNVWQEIILPTLLDKTGWALFIGTPKGFNVFYDLYTKAMTLPDWETFHFTSYDNPILKHTELDRLKNEMGEDKYMQEIMADFRRYEGVVYKEFDRETHIFSDISKINEKEIIAGLDWGFTNPAGALRIVVDYDNNYWITNEYYKTGKTTEEICEYVKSWTPGLVYPDPAEPDRIVIARSLGLYVRDVNKDVKSGIDKVRQLLRENRLKVHESCTNFIKEIERYRYDEDAPAGKEDNPIKEDDHLMDALRYALFMHSPSSNSGNIDYLFEETPTHPDIWG